MNEAKIGAEFSGSVMGEKMLMQLLGGTFWDFECFDKDGRLKWQQLNRPNIITTQGLNYLWDIGLGAGTQITAWFVNAVETNTTAAITMTYAVPVFTEWDGFTQAARIAFVPAASAGGVITNSASKAVFTSAEAKTLYGGALFGGGTDADTWKDTAGGGTLFCYSKFAASEDVENGDTFKITCSGTLTNA